MRCEVKGVRGSGVRGSGVHGVEVEGKGLYE